MNILLIQTNTTNIAFIQKVTETTLYNTYVKMFTISRMLQVKLLESQQKVSNVKYA